MSERMVAKLDSSIIYKSHIRLFNKRLRDQSNLSRIGTDVNFNARWKKKKKKKTEIVLNRNFSGSVFLFSEKIYKIVKKSKVGFEIEKSFSRL